MELNLQENFMTFLIQIQRVLRESARWLASRGWDDEAIGYLEKVAKWNRRELPSREILAPIVMACRDEGEDGRFTTKKMNPA